MGRLLLALMISKSLTDAPWLYLSAFFDEHRDEYVEKLFKVSTKGQWYQWIEFCLRAVIFQAKDSIKRCKAFQALKKDFHNRVEPIATKHSHNLIEWLFEKTAFTVKEVAERLETSYNTAKKNVEVLTKVGIIKEAQSTYPAIYYSPELLVAANEDF
jgi:Fic family protein